ncbi:MAG: hypothetical protein ACREPM_00040, partial [Gemmatimonadaceae bacterium]
MAVVGTGHGGIADWAERALRGDAEVRVTRVSAFGEPAQYAAYETMIAVVGHDSVEEAVAWFARLRAAAPAVALLAIGDRIDFADTLSLLGGGAFDFVSC